MKKKFITGVLLLAVTACGFSTFTSCKDTDEDFRNEMLSQQVNLKATLQKLQEQLNQCPTNCQAKIDSLKQELLGLLANKNDVYTKAEVDALLDALKDVYLTQATWESIMEGDNGVLKRLEKLENPGTGTATSSPADAMSQDDVDDILGLIALKTQLENLFNADGSLKIQSSIDEINDILNGKDGKPGLISKVDDLSKWFEGKDWTVTDFQDAVEQGMWVSNNHQALEDLVDLLNDGTIKEDALKELNKYFNDLEGIDVMYKKIWKDAQLPEDAEDWWNYGEVMQNIMDNSAAIEELQKDVEKLLNRLNDMVTSLVLQATTNSVFGSFNTPFGINSMVLMAPYGELTTSVREFPVNPDDKGDAECYMKGDIDWSEIISGDVYDLNTLGSKFIVALNENNQAKLGNLWFTVNPSSVKVKKDKFAIVNSVENDPVKLVRVEKDDETVLKFGIGSRATIGNGNGLYTAEAVVDPEKLDEIKVHIQPGLVESLKDAVKNHTASDMVHMLKTIYNQLQDVCDANALRYTYNAATGKDENGNWISEEHNVYSNYGMAATAFKPLSYATLKGTSFDVHFPTFGSISIPEDLVNLDLGTFEIDGNTFKLNLNFGEPVFTPIGDVIVPVTLKDKDGNEVTGTINIKEQAQEIQDNVTDAIKEWLGKDGGMDARVEKAIWLALFYDPSASDNKYTPAPGESQSIGVVTNLVNQVNDMTGSIQDKLNDLVDKINNEYLGKVNSLLSKYNTVAERISNMLKDPNHYLQSVMLYRKAGKLALNGHTPEVELPFGILSTNPKQPTQFKGAGEAISLWATSYTFETVAPAFKKIVGVVSVKDQTGAERDDLKLEANKTLAKVMNGDQTRVALNVKNAKGGTFTYEVAFQALDYTGHTSTVKCYLQVVR